MRSQLVMTILVSALIIYVVGVYTGWYITQTQVESTEEKVREIEESLDNIREWTKLSDERMCPVLEVQFQDELKKLELFWKTLPKKVETGDVSEDTLRAYVDAEVEAYLLSKTLETRCNKKTNIILYFLERKKPESIQAGNLLDEAGVDAIILTMPVDVGSPMAEALAKSFNITSYPAVRTCEKTIIWPFTKEELSEAVSECNP